MHRKWKNSENPQYLQIFTEIRVRVENELKKSRENFYLSKFYTSISDKKQHKLLKVRVLMLVKKISSA